MMAAPVLYRHPCSLAHDVGPHPEQPARIVAIERAIAAADGIGYEQRLSSAASRAQLEAVHSGAHIDTIASLCAAGGGQIDADTAVVPGSWEAALHAAGGACAVVDTLVRERRQAVSLHRPPGHHAEPERAMGFCLFNNMAIAARWARQRHGIERLLIVDWDVHHGNGTQAALYDSDEAFYCSIHQSPLYPGTGATDERGRGDGEGFTLNLPVPAGSGDELFCSLVEHLIVAAGRRYRPQLILISAGFDAHAADPLAACSVTEQGYRTMTRSLRALGDLIDAPVGLVLEGGYDLAALAASTVAVLEQLAAPSPVTPPQLARHASIADYRQ